MNIENLNEFKKLLINSKNPVSDIEYTKGNYDKFGNLIKEDLPTITTDFCEIGLYDKEIYFVFIIKPKTFNVNFFNEIRHKQNVKIYGFKNFNKTLFPIPSFDYNNFIKEIKKDKYLQVQFDFKKISTSDLFNKYINLIKIFKNNNITVINQLKTNLTN